MYPKTLFLSLVLATFCLSACTNEIGAEREAEVGPELAYPGETGPHHRAEVRFRGETLALTVEVLHGEVIAEGDMLLARHASAVDLDGDVSVEALAAVPDLYLWPEGRVPFELADDLPAVVAERTRQAMDHWQDNTPIRFIERTDEDDYVSIRSSEGCSAFVGRVGGVQSVNLSTSCSFGSVVHELGHAIGLFHTQSRVDRDDHIIVHSENIQEDREHNFQTYGLVGRDGQDVGLYDFGSVMHYGSFFFSNGGGPTITTLDGDTFVANRSGLSELDIRNVRRLYAPGPPVSPRVSAGVSEVTLTWDRPERGARVATRYDIFRGRAPLGQTDQLSFVDDTVAPSTVYMYHLFAVAEDGSRSTPVVLIVRTLNVVEPSPASGPTPPGDLRGEVYSSTALEIFWTRATDDGVVVSYDVSRDGVLVTNRDATSYFEEGLSPDTEYQYRVIAIDDEGNRSTPTAVSLRTRVR